MIAFAGLVQGQQFKTSTSLVEVDVVVHSKDHAAVTGLRASDFNVFEDGVRQEIRSFVEIGSAGIEGVARSHSGQTNSTDGRREPSSDESPAGFAALVFEQLSPEGRRLAGDAASAFVSEALASNISVGVYTVDRAPHMLARWTRERPTLDNAIEKARRFAGYPIEYAGEVPGAEYGAGTPPGWIPPASPSTALDRQYNRGHATLDGLAAIVSALGPLPERKVLLLFSEGLALGADPFGNRDSGLDDNRWTRLQRIIERANSVRIAFYTFDAVGLRAQDPATIARRMANLGQSPFGLEPYVGLLSLAKDTGGMYASDSNDLVKFAGRAADDVRHYYLIGYSPSNQNFDGKFRSISVNLNLDGLIVQARKGYRATAHAEK